MPEIDPTIILPARSGLDWWVASFKTDDFMSGLEELHLSIAEAASGCNRIVIRNETNGTYTLSFYRFARARMDVMEVVKGVFLDRVAFVIARQIGFESTVTVIAKRGS